VDATDCERVTRVRRSEKAPFSYVSESDPPRVCVRAPPVEVALATFASSVDATIVPRSPLAWIAPPNASVDPPTSVDTARLRLTVEPRIVRGVTSWRYIAPPAANEFVAAPFPRPNVRLPSTCEDLSVKEPLMTLIAPAAPPACVPPGDDSARARLPVTREFSMSRFPMWKIAPPRAPALEPVPRATFARSVDPKTRIVPASE
jgi:hypothetical protein